MLHTGKVCHLVSQEALWFHFVPALPQPATVLALVVGMHDGAPRKHASCHNTSAFALVHSHCQEHAATV